MNRPPQRRGKYARAREATHYDAGDPLTPSAPGRTGDGVIDLPSKPVREWLDAFNAAAILRVAIARRIADAGNGQLELRRSHRCGIASRLVRPARRQFYGHKWFLDRRNCPANDVPVL